MTTARKMASEILRTKHAAELDLALRGCSGFGDVPSIRGLNFRSRAGSAIAGGLIAITVIATSCTGKSSSPQATETPTSATQPPASETAPAGELPISSDGLIAYQSMDSNGDDRVFLVHIDGSGDHAIAQQLPGRVAHPDFSRDGSQLVFDQLTSQDSTDQIYLAKADGSNIRHIAPCKPPKCLSHWEASWSPDGQQLAMSTATGPFTDTGPSRVGIAIVDVESEKVRQVVDHPGEDGQDHFARWSPDGKHLVFWRARAQSDGSVQTAIFIVNSDGSRLNQLTPWNMLAGDPDWAPDGSLIVFGTSPLLDFSEAAESELYTMRPDGSGMHALTSYGPTGPRATQPRWTPDGHAILYTRLGQSELPRHIWAISADGSVDVPVLTSKSIYTHPVLQPA
jgi:Tol biopolymer transport system component